MTKKRVSKNLRKLSKKYTKKAARRRIKQNKNMKGGSSLQPSGRGVSRGASRAGRGRGRGGGSRGRGSRAGASRAGRGSRLSGRGPRIIRAPDDLVLTPLGRKNSLRIEDSIQAARNFGSNALAEYRTKAEPEPINPDIIKMMEKKRLAIQKEERIKQAKIRKEREENLKKCSQFEVRKTILYEDDGELKIRIENNRLYARFHNGHNFYVPGMPNDALVTEIKNGGAMKSRTLTDLGGVLNALGLNSSLQGNVFLMNAAILEKLQDVQIPIPIPNFRALCEDNRRLWDSIRSPSVKESTNLTIENQMRIASGLTISGMNEFRLAAETTDRLSIWIKISAEDFKKYFNICKYNDYFCHAVLHINLPKPNGIKEIPIQICLLKCDAYWLGLPTGMPSLI